MIVFTVVYYDERSEGNAGDGTHIAHFRRKSNAEAFAAGRTCYGQPATVDENDVPARVRQRWSFHD